SLLCAREEWSIQLCVLLHMASTCYYSMNKPGNYENVPRLKPFDLAETPCGGIEKSDLPSICSDVTSFLISSISGLTANLSMGATRLTWARESSVMITFNPSSSIGRISHEEDFLKKILEEDREEILL
ncbi:hypothetical protein PENTCL1PPCAC_5692, partial [Pristionchus entomophagus]